MLKSKCLFNDRQGVTEDFEQAVISCHLTSQPLVNKVPLIMKNLSTRRATGGQCFLMDTIVQRVLYNIQITEEGLDEGLE